MLMPPELSVEQKIRTITESLIEIFSSDEIEKILQNNQLQFVINNFRLKENSSYFDFNNKLQTIIQAFENEGLTLEQLKKSIIRIPQILSHSPESIIENINGVFNRFSKTGMTKSQYIRAAIKAPQLF